jgi:hypothetical protein
LVQDPEPGRLRIEHCFPQIQSREPERVQGIVRVNTPVSDIFRSGSKIEAPERTKKYFWVPLSTSSTSIYLC